MTQTPEPIYTDEEFKELFDTYVDVAGNTIAEMEVDQLSAMLFIHNDGKVVIVDISEGFIDDEHKHEAMQKTGFVLYEKKIIADIVILISEVWISEKPYLDPDTKQPILRPSQDPLRREGIAITGMSIDKKVCMSIYDIVRDSYGHVHIGDLHSEMKVGTQGERLEAPILDAFFKGYALAWYEENKERFQEYLEGGEAN